MNVADLVEKRRAQWSELEFLCNQMEVRGRTRSGMSADLTRFSSLYRAACADLALADAYQLPPATVNYLHNLVARAHNRLYRSSSVTFKDLWDTVFLIAPQQIFADPCVRIAAVIFFGLFSLSAIIGTREEEYPEFVNQMVGSQQVDMMEEMHENPPWNNPGMGGSFSGAGQYISHNTGIGITCFSYGILLIPCIATLGYNAVTLGTVFGYMARESVPAGDNFLH
ncbi:MAG: stage II sporulation protein M [Planctomycetota bacterium]